MTELRTRPVTEEEASSLWCPFSFGKVPTGVCVAPAIAA